MPVTFYGWTPFPHPFPALPTYMIYTDFTGFATDYLLRLLHCGYLDRLVYLTQ